MVILPHLLNIRAPDLDPGTIESSSELVHKRVTGHPSSGNRHSSDEKLAIPTQLWTINASIYNTAPFTDSYFGLFPVPRESPYAYPRCYAKQTSG